MAEGYGSYGRSVEGKIVILKHDTRMARIRTCFIFALNFFHVIIDAKHDCMLREDGGHASSTEP